MSENRWKRERERERQDGRSEKSVVRTTDAAELKREKIIYFSIIIWFINPFYETDAC